MVTRREQAQAYRFLIRRQTSALVRGQPDSAEAPLRKLNTGMLASVLIGALAVAGFGIWGLVSPGRSASWRDGQAIILEKGTDTQFVYADGVLHPVLNYASARLLMGASGYTVDTVAATSLDRVPRGLPVGIPGAPNEIPATSALITAPWTTCSIPAQNATGGVAPFVQLTAGQPPPGTGLGPDQAALVTAPDGTEYLIWNDARLRVDGAFVPAALGYAAVRPLPVGAAWLDTVPQAPDLAALPVPGEGSPVSYRAAGQPVLVGQVFAVANIGTVPQLYLALADGLAPITQTQADLHLADPATQAAYPGRAIAALTLTAGDLSEAPRSARTPALESTLPATPPALIDTAGTSTEICSTFADTSGASTAVEVTARTLAPASLAAVPAGTAPVDPQGGPLADQAAIPPGRGAVVRALTEPGVTDGTVYLVTDLGVKFPLGGTDVLASLGLSGVQPSPLPAALLQLLRTGPELDQADAAVTNPILPDQNGSPAPAIPVPAAANRT